MRFKQKQPVVQTAINNALSGGGGGGGGTTDYTELENKPQINSVTLSGNKTTSDLGIDEVPAVTSEDNGKILKATYSEGTGSYAWESAGGFTQVQANWNESDTTDPSYIQNKPSIPAAQVQSDWSQSDNTAVDYIKNKPSIPAAQVQADWDESDNTDPSYIKNKPTIPAAQVNSDWTANSGVAQILNKPDLSDMATQTWVGQQGYLTSADEVPTVGSSDDGKVLTATYSGGTGSYAWDYLPSVNEVPNVGSSDDGKVLTASYSGGTGSFAWATPSGGSGFTNVTLSFTSFHDNLSYYITNDGVYFVCLSCEGQDGSYGGIYIQHGSTMCFTGFTPDTNTSVASNIYISGIGQISPDSLSQNAILSFYPIQIFPPV